MGVDERPQSSAFVPLLPRELEFAIEFRDADWFDERTFDLLRNLVRDARGERRAVAADPRRRCEVAEPRPAAFQLLALDGAPRHQRLNARHRRGAR
jgi:uncharacterized protein YecE (DUF72 family)